MATSLIREIGRTNQKEYVKENVGAEHIGRFLVEFTDRLLKFSGESYKLRNALVGVQGKLVLICS